MNEPDTTLLLFDFSEPGAVAEWDAIDDRVMGGVSSSRLRNDPAGHAVFEGNVSLERNGGFASIRSTPADRGKPGIGRCWPVSGSKVDNEANTPVQTVHADFPHTAYQWSVGSQHYAVLPLPGGLPG